MSSIRPTAGRSVTLTGLLQTLRYRYHSFRWIAAGGAAVAVFLALNSDPQGTDPATDLSDPTNILDQERLASRLPAETRGVTIPTSSEVLTPGDYVDVHEVSTGTAVVGNVLVVEVTEDDTLIAVPTERIDTVVDSMTTGGVILVLVPRSTS